MEDKWRRWVLITAIAPIAWGSTYVVTRHLLPPDVPLWGAVIRCLPAGLLVLLFARRLPRGSWWWRSLLLGLLNVGGFSVLIYIVGQRLPSSLAATLMSTSAACIMLFAWALLGQRPRVAAALGAAVGIAGVVLMLGVGAGSIDPWGIAASLGAMVASSFGFVLTSRWGQGVPALAMTSWQLLAGSVVLVPVALVVEGPPPQLTPEGFVGFAYVMLIGTAVAYAAWFAGLQRLPAAAVGLVGLLNPVTGVVLGVVLAGEAFGPPQVVGLALVLGGVVWGVLPHRRRVTRQESVPGRQSCEAPEPASRGGMKA